MNARLVCVVMETVCFCQPDHDNLDKARPVGYVVSIK